MRASSGSNHTSIVDSPSRGTLRSVQTKLIHVGLTLLILLPWSLGCGRQPATKPTSSETTPAETPQQVSLDSRMLGSAACAQCHPDQYATYRQTTHSRSFSLVDPALEPPDGELLHEPSGRRFRSFRQGDQLWHVDSLTFEGEELAKSAHPLKYLVGSGKHSRTYLVEIEGFLFESPLTWYESRKCWSLSPGYDTPQPRGFERPGDYGCVVCHVGRAEQIDDSLHRLSFHELAIGCERCHGAGQTHVELAEKLRSGEAPPGAIANPARLTRSMSEDICAQCHLRGVATVYHPGQSPETFEPGRPLSLTRLDFLTAESRETMSVVGHVEQMRLSRCYTATETFNCITCHDMHAPEPVDKIAYFRGKCLDCHGTDTCGLPVDGNLRLERRDDCAACHMPRGDTDIPHIAFTHHRVGIHRPEDRPMERRSTAPLPRLVVHSGGEQISPHLLERGLGLAYLEISSSRTTPESARACEQESLQKLLKYYRSHPGDGTVESALARLLLEINPLESEQLAERALHDPALPAHARVDALLVRSLILLDRGEDAAARKVLEQLTRLRHTPGDLELLASSITSRSSEEAIPPMRRAVDLRPHDPELLELLAGLLRDSGQSEPSRVLIDRAQKIEKVRPSE